MSTRTVFGVIVAIFFLTQAGYAAERADIKKHFNDTACQVKATTDPVQKREILDNSLQTMGKALDWVERAGLISADDRVGVDRFRTNLREKQDELMGRNGYERVSDAQLNAFSDYVVQDMEQADRNINISLVSALLIVIILILVL